MSVADLLVVVFVCAPMLGLGGFAVYVDRAANRRSRARLAEMERRREESRVYWDARIRETAAVQQRPVSVAPFIPLPHNPGRRRILPAN